MAHFARLDENNKVVEVIVVSNDNIINLETGLEDENIGINFCKSLYGNDTKWSQTSYNGKIRGNYAGIGFSYDEKFNLFLPPKPYESWIVDLEIGNWNSPVPKPPSDEYFGSTYVWYENEKHWFSIKEYIYNKYAKDFEYSEIEDIVNTYDLKDNRITRIHGNENYYISIEKVKNFLFAHISFYNWNEHTSIDWKNDYDLHKYNTANAVYFSAKYCPDDRERSLTKKFGDSHTDYYFLEEINNWLIYRRDKVTN
jgi:hypothetical protein